MLSRFELEQMRAVSESAMPDELRITRVGAGEPALDPVTGVFAPPPETVIYQGIGRLRPPTPTENERIFADREVTVQRYVAKVPWDVVDAARGDRLAVVSGTDPALAEMSFRVLTVLAGSNLIDRTIGVEVIET